jgi:CubicO group peptidase (beta-lactamase class C family)
MTRMSDDLFADAAAVLAGWERDRDLSGCCLVTRGGETLFEASWGFADQAARVPNSQATRFGLASLTKMFTAVVVATLVRDGRLAFETPVVDVLPVHLRPTTLDAAVSVHHLLCHTSGIADYAEEDEDSPRYVEDYGALWIERPSYLIERPADFLPLFADLPAYRPPGQSFQYSNAGYILLGLVIEQIAGTPYPEAVRARVLEPAGMTASGFFRLDEAVPNVATGYRAVPPPGLHRRTNIYSIPVVGGADGGAMSTTGDLDRFLHAYADGTLLGDLTEVMLRPHADASDGFFEGYGVHLYPDGGWGHGGGDPGVAVIANRWPHDDLDVVVLSNTAGPVGEVRDLLRQTAA